MRGTFNGSQSADVFDHGAAYNFRRNQEERAKLDRHERAAKWLTAKMRGQSFDSLEALTDAALAVTVAHYGRALDETEKTLIVRAAVSLWLGFLDHSYFVGKILITRGEKIEFLSAA